MTDAKTAEERAREWVRDAAQSLCRAGIDITSPAEGFALEAYLAGAASVGDRHRWNLSSNHPEMKRCVICGEKDVCIENSDDETSKAKGMYRGACCGEHAGSVTAWYDTRQKALDAWNYNKAPFEMIEKPEPLPYLLCIAQELPEDSK